MSKQLFTDCPPDNDYSQSMALKINWFYVFSFVFVELFVFQEDT